MQLSKAEEKIHEQSAAQPDWRAGDLVELSPDHPGFHDPGYRARRNAIARLALEYQSGPVPRVEYTDGEQETWREVVRHLGPLHERYACRAYQEGREELRLDGDRVPQLADVNLQLGRSTGFTLRPVAGLVKDRTFLGHLAKDTFLSTQYMRHPSRPLYTPEPDVVHELIGHAATFCSDAFARMNRAFGAAALRASPELLAQVARLYWYSLEFGVCREGGELKVCGAGLLSSFGELERFEAHARLREFDAAEIVETAYDPTGYQATLFVAPSFEQLVDSVCAWLDRP